MFQLTTDAEQALLAKEETGPGFQLVKGELGGDSVVGIVFNATLFFKPSELLAGLSGDYEEFLESSHAEPGFTVTSVLPTLEAEGYASGSGSWVSSLASAFAPSPVLQRNSLPREGFVRFSAYRQDKRVTPKNGLYNGSYATSIGDARFAVSGLAVAGRYALPNPMPAIFAYTVVPSAPVPIVLGTVRPAFGQSGGGVEVFFPNGASDWSVMNPYEIPTI